jgi:hypothetical protein
VEYFAGAGFASVQKYMVKVIFQNLDQKKNISEAARIKARKAAASKALQFGPKLSSGVSFSQAIWHAANFWKHEGEWWEVAFSDDYLNQGKDNLLAHGEFGAFGGEWLCANVLFEISCCSEIRLGSVLPLLEEWRTELLEAADDDDLASHSKEGAYGPK